MYIDSSTNYNININTNADAIKLREILSNSTDKLSQSMQRMSSGLKINSAKDDAVGAVLSARMLVELQGNQICQNNIQQASAMLSSTSDSLDSVLYSVSRIRDLVIQAKNGTYSDGEIKIMQDEVQQHIAEIDRLSENSKFLKLNLFGGDLAENGISFQVGPNGSDDNTIAIDSSLGIFDSVKFDDILKYTPKDKSAKTVDLTGEEKTVSGSKVVINITDSGEIVLSSNEAEFLAEDENKIYYLATGDAKEGYYTIVKNSDNYKAEGLQVLYQYKGEIKSETALESIKDAKVGDVYTVGNKAYEYRWEANKEGGTFVWGELNSSIAKNVIPEDIVIQPYDEDDDEKKFNLYSINNDEKSYETAINALDGAIDNITGRKSTIGSILSRLTSAFDTLTAQYANLSKAKSIITDADIAAEASNYTQNQILQQVSTSLLAQANQSPAIALSLI